MAYFDFQNTPIESDITLKAKWCCGSQEEPYPEGWTGNGAMRVTLTDGRVLVTDNLKSANQTLVGNMVYQNGMTGQTQENITGYVVEGTNTAATFKTGQVKKIDFGKGYTSGAGYSSIMNKYMFPALTSITGFQKGTTTLPGFLLSAIPDNLTGVVLNIPEGLANPEAILTSIRYSAYSKIICNSPPPVLSSYYTQKFLCHSKNEYGTLGSNVYLNLSGPYADDWMAAYPNGEFSSGFYIRRLKKV